MFNHFFESLLSIHKDKINNMNNTFQLKTLHFLSGIGSLLYQVFYALIAKHQTQYI